MAGFTNSHTRSHREFDSGVCAVVVVILVPWRRHSSDIMRPWSSVAWSLWNSTGEPCLLHRRSNSACATVTACLLSSGKRMTSLVETSMAQASSLWPSSLSGIFLKSNAQEV